MGVIAADQIDINFSIKKVVYINAKQCYEPCAENKVDTLHPMPRYFR
jgi:hypothetical protein